jgi:two-component system, NarL family, sensor histidine kinase UhpB
MNYLPNLLIVDDTRENLAFLEVVIRKIKVNLIQALSGPEALEKTRGIELALAIIDVRMPEMNGYELALKMNEERSGDKVPVIFLTANNSNEMDVVKGYSTGAADYLFKPVHNHILLSKINVFIDLFNQKQTIIRDAALLKESEANLAEAQRNAHIGSWEWNMISNKLKWSEEMFRVFDICPDNFDGKLVHVMKVIHPDDVDIFANSMNGDLSDNSTPIEYRIIHKDGSVHNVFAEGRTEFDKTGKRYRRIGTVQDITKRKKDEDELISSLDQLHKLTQYIEKVREDERVAISRELHDDLGQALTAVKIDLGIIKQMVSENDVILKINKVSALVGETIKTVQRLTSQLRPEIIDDLGLEAAIEWYTKEFAQRNKVAVILDMDSGISISPEASLIVFRIMQESLTNIARHSGANRVDIGLLKTGEYINFRISDNGVGITEGQIKAKKSFGIISMKERAASLGGTFEIYRQNDSGTIINLIFPLN